MLLHLPQCASAAELEVRLSVRGRGPLAHAAVILSEPLVEKAPPFARARSTFRRFTTSTKDGVATFLDLPPGVFQANLFGLEALGLVSPHNNPSAPPPVITLEAGETRRIEIEVWPGVPVVVGGTVDRGPFLGVFEGGVFEGTVRVRHRDSGFEHRFPMSLDYHGTERFLSSGIWEVFVEPPAGYLLDSLVHDGYALAGHRVTLDLDDQPLGQRIDFGYRAEARIYGTVTLTGPAPPIAVEATLLEPGPWFAEAEGRGGSTLSAVVRGVRGPPHGDFELPVASGRYRVRPISAAPIDSDPPEVEVTVARGESIEIDFAVEPGAGPESLWVRVTDADFRPLTNAMVEVYEERPDGVVELRADESATPVASARTDDRGRTRIFGLDSGEVYRVVAGHADALESSAPIRFDPERRRQPIQGIPSGTSLTLVLGRGASFVVEARDAAGEPLRNVAIEVLRHAAREPAAGPEPGERTPASEAEPSSLELPPFLLRDAGFRAAKERRELVTDRRGHARASGFYPGVYRLTGHLEGSEAVLGRILLSVDRQQVRRFRRPPRVDPAVIVELEGEEQVAVDARLLPAARFEATLLCADGGPLPATADVHVMRASVAQNGVVLGVDHDQPAVELLGRALSGPRSNRVEAGPLDDGTFEIAIRPEGHQRFTWAYETFERTRALPLTVDTEDVRRGRALELGTFVIECEPTVDLLLEPPAGVTFDRYQLTIETHLFDRELADLRGRPSPPEGLDNTASTVAPGSRPVAQPSPRATPERELRSPRYRLDGLTLSLDRVETGPTLLVVVLRHPHFLPAGEQRYEILLELERGGYRELALSIPRLGGSLTVQAETDSDASREREVGRISSASTTITVSSTSAPTGWVRVVRGDGGNEVRLAPMSSAGVMLPALEPGSYRVELCADRDCTRVERAFGQTLVAAGVDTRVSLSDGTAPRAEASERWP